MRGTRSPTNFQSQNICYGVLPHLWPTRTSRPRQSSRIWPESETCRLPWARGNNLLPGRYQPFPAGDGASQGQMANNTLPPPPDQAVLGEHRPPGLAGPMGNLLYSLFGRFCLGDILLETADGFDQRRHLAWGVHDRADLRMVRIHLKTDQFGKGVDIVLGRTGLDICPVAAVLGYIAARGDSPGPFFVDSRSRPVLKSSFVQAVRGVIASLGLPQDQFAGHSFWIGAVTAAAMAGAEDSTIQLLGRWHSTAFLRYVRTPPERLAALSATLVGHSNRLLGGNAQSRHRNATSAPEL